MADPIKFRDDFDQIVRATRETRTPERLAAHFEIESRLATRLRTSNAQERRELYPSLYSELFAGLPDHPQHRISSDSRERRLAHQSAFLLRRLKADAVYVEIGCGDAALTKLIAPNVRSAIGVDVTDALIGAGPHPPQFQFLHTDGTWFDLGDDAVDLVYSNQLMEHLHPDDAIAQLVEIRRTLRPGGQYICVTPNRLTGPHDISRYFGYEPRGFHLQEYDHASLDRTFRAAGFRSVRPIVFLKGRDWTPPLLFATGLEAVLSRLPRPLRTAIALRGPVANLAGVTIVGVK